MSEANRNSLSETVEEYEEDELANLLMGKGILKEVALRTAVVIGELVVVYGAIEIAKYYHLADYFR